MERVPRGAPAIPIGRASTRYTFAGPAGGRRSRAPRRPIAPRSNATRGAGPQDTVWTAIASDSGGPAGPPGPFSLAIRPSRHRARRDRSARAGDERAVPHDAGPRLWARLG